MSVLKSRRELSEMQFFQTGVDIQNKLIEFCMNEKNIPKKYRFVYAMPIIEQGEKLVENIVSANTIYPTTNEEVMKRREYQTEALANCEKILQKLQSLRRTLGVDSGILKEIVGMIVNERGYIVAWRKSDNQRYKEIAKKKEQSAEARIKKLKQIIAATILSKVTEDDMQRITERAIERIAKM